MPLDHLSSSPHPDASPPQSPIADALVLFFTDGISLHDWHATGLIGREWALYQRLAPHFRHLILVTYGSADAPHAAALVPAPVLISNDQRLPREQYPLTIPARLAAEFTRLQIRTAILKSNQFATGPVLVHAADELRRQDHRVGIVARGGYLWSKLASIEKSPDSPEAHRAAAAEATLCRAADIVISTTARIVEDLSWRYHVPAARLRTIPNYVISDASPLSSAPRDPNRLLFAGRLVPVKRVDLLIRAVADLPAALRDRCVLEIVGDGPLLPTLKALAKETGVACDFVPRMPHEVLLERMARCALYLQASASEGHPKTVLEAMSVACPVIVADTPGLGDVVRQGVTGIKVASDPASFAHAISELLADDDWRETLGQAAALEIRRSLALDAVVPLEREALHAAFAHGRTQASDSLAWIRASPTTAATALADPAPAPHALTPPAALAPVRLLVLDFDGVLTDNRVLVSQDGIESVFCSRGDGLGLTTLRDTGFPILVLSKEKNPVVAARCAKLKLECHQGIDAKLPYLQQLAAQRHLDRSQIAYVGNDTNDAGPLGWVGVPIVVADAHPAVLPLARLITTRPGGQGAVREVCDWLLALRPPAPSAP